MILAWHKTRQVKRDQKFWATVNKYADEFELEMGKTKFFYSPSFLLLLLFFKYFLISITFQKPCSQAHHAHHYFYFINTIRLK